MKNNFPRPPKKGEPHYEEFDAVRRELIRVIDDYAWIAVIVAHGKLSHAYVSDPFNLTQYHHKTLDIVENLQFKIAIVSGKIDDLFKGGDPISVE